MRRQDMKRLTKYFFEGLIVLVPILGSIYIIYLVFTKIDSLLGLSIPGVGFVITIAFITFVGLLASSFLTEKLFHLLDRIFVRLPLVKIIYTSIHDLMGSFVGEKKTFDRPVLVTIDRAGGARALGFITSESLEFLGLRDHVSVYLPQSYNFGGNLYIYPSDRVEPVKAPGTDVMTFIVSGGVTGGNKKNQQARAHSSTING